MKKWKAYSKIVKVIESCESRGQLKIARSMYYRFQRMFNDSQLDGDLDWKCDMKYRSYS